MEAPRRYLRIAEYKTWRRAPGVSHSGGTKVKSFSVLYAASYARRSISVSCRWYVARRDGMSATKKAPRTCTCLSPTRSRANGITKVYSLYKV